MERPRFLEDTSLIVLAIAKAMFDAVVNGDPARALRLDPVIRWSPSDWEPHAAAMREIKFDRHNPAHLAALQAMIDQACDNEEKNGSGAR